MEAAALLAEAEMQDLYKYIDCLPDGNILCHFDFHPNNIILSDNNYSIIDWMTACKGDTAGTGRQHWGIISNDQQVGNRDKYE